MEKKRVGDNRGKDNGAINKEKKIGKRRGRIFCKVKKERKEVVRT